MKLIDKDKVVAEIEKLVDKGKYNEEYDCAYRDGINAALHVLKKRLDTLETKEVDLGEVHYKPLDEDFERDAVSFCFDSGLNTTPYIAKTIAKHFFELGLKTKGG